MFERSGNRDPLYLFACHLEWQTKRNLACYNELLAALDDVEEGIGVLAKELLQRSSPRPSPTENYAEN